MESPPTGRQALSFFDYAQKDNVYFTEGQKLKENKQKTISEGDFEEAIKKIENKKRK